MKLRLIAKGFTNYTGQMGVINFVDGLSVNDVLHIDAIRVAGVIGAEWEDGSAANVSQMYLDNMHTRAKTSEELDKREEAPLVKEDTKNEPVAAADTVSYTEERLAEIADKDGIAGLRLIATPMGIKGSSIAALIAEIVKTAPIAKEEKESVDDDKPAEGAKETTGSSLSSAQMASMTV